MEHEEPDAPATWPQDDTVRLTRAEVVADVATCFEDALQSEREESWYEAHNLALSYLTGLYRTATESFNVAPQAPLFARRHAWQSDSDGAGSAGGPEGDDERMVVDDLFSGKGAQKGIRWYHEGGSRKQVAETTDSDSEARGTGYDEDEEMSARFTAERSSARETGKERNNLNSSTSSKPLTDDGHISEDDIKHRLADFVIIRRRGQTRAVVSVVEVKPQPWTKDSLFNKGAERLAARTRVSEMMPQVVQQVQFAFREHSSLQRVWALCLVGHWCRFLCFDREKTPGIVYDDIHPRGYKPDPAKNEPEADEVPSSESAVFPILTEDGHDFHPDFKTHWLEFMKWARSMELQD